MKVSNYRKYLEFLTSLGRTALHQGDRAVLNQGGKMMVCGEDCPSFYGGSCACANDGMCDHIYDSYCHRCGLDSGGGN
jgi:hypothetical protein